MSSKISSLFLFFSLQLALLLTVSTVNCLHKQGHGMHSGMNLVPGKDVIYRNLITYYMYNITNPDEFEAGEKPVFVEVGPYVYRETRRKFNIRKVSELKDDVMNYTVDRFWEFMPELSEGHEETDEFNVINIPMVILASKLATKNLPKAFNDILVDELREKGDSLVRRNQEIGNVLYHGMNVSIYTEILDDVLHGNVPPEYSDDRFALFKNQNGTVEGTYTVRTKGPNRGDILSFNNKTKLDYWSGDKCNSILGTDGYYFRPGVTEKSTLKIFYPELCRSVYLKWKGEKNYKGISVAKFSFPEDMLEDPDVNEDNICFCSKPIKATNNTKETCLKRGFIDYAGCKQESPLLLSYPHFLYADEEYRNKIIGLKPIPEKHETEFLVEPKTGTIVSAVRRFQFNVKIRPLDNVEFFINSILMIVPVFNVERRMIIAESTMENLKEDLQTLTEEKSNKDLYNVNEGEDQESIEKNKLSERIGSVAVHSEPESVAEDQLNDHKTHRHPQKHSSSFANKLIHSNFCLPIVVALTFSVLKL